MMRVPMQNRLLIPSVKKSTEKTACLSKKSTAGLFERGSSEEKS